MHTVHSKKIRGGISVITILISIAITLWLLHASGSGDPKVSWYIAGIIYGLIIGSIIAFMVDSAIDVSKNKPS
jgi:hypothetical protein